MRDDQLASLACEVARELPSEYAEKQRKSLSELFHLQPATNRVVEQLVQTWKPIPSLIGKKFGDTLGWVGLGNVDTVFTREGGTRTFLELKCDTDLSACVWDAVKLASGLLNGNTDAGYMLAGSPTSHWQKPIRGAELFERERWRTTGPEIRDAYLDWWRSWELEGHIPGRVAGSFATVPLGSFPSEIEGVAWELRLVRVEPCGAAWLDWEPIVR